MTMADNPQSRATGLLLSLPSLPGRHGVGDMGAYAYRLIDLLAANRVRYWQILPINPAGFGNSPYQPYASAAGDPLFISLDVLHEQGLLPEPIPAYHESAGVIRYAEVRAYKERALRRAFSAFRADDAYDTFCTQPWVYPYAVFMAFKRAAGMCSWSEWPTAQKNWPRDRAVDLTPFDGDIRFEMFAQYIFYQQWDAVRRYANAQGVSIIGDIPIYVGMDSLDVWSQRENFLLDANGTPTAVAGVPPDYFSATGQRWGNPLYDWDYMQRDGFAFWISRLRYAMDMFDVIRIDHFRGFDTYWAIPATSSTAENGVWREAPGYALFETVLQALPGIRIIAEDLGMLREEVYVLRDAFHFPGMKILQFTFDPYARQTPRDGSANMVVYTGTHDNQTLRGWYDTHSFRWRMRTRVCLWQSGYRAWDVIRALVQLALDDAAALAIIPAADLLALGDNARINLPGTIGTPNWTWKLKDLQALDAALDTFQADAARYGRS